MKKIEFKKVSAKNFLCFGEKGIELELQNLGNIVLVRGKNLDTLKKGEEQRLASNGSGKSSLPEILVYGLYGKTIKSPSKITTKDVINQNVGKNMSIEVYWDDYRVERKRKPDSLRLWKNDQELTLGGMPATQKLIEDILGLNYQSFVNVVVFTDDNSSSFLECNAAEKRNIIENLLSLEKYKTYHENAKLLAKQHGQEIKTMEMQASYAEQNLGNEQSTMANLKANVKTWKLKKIEEIKDLAEQKKLADEELLKIENSQDLQDYENAQNQIKDLNKSLDEIRSEQDVLLENIKQAEALALQYKNEKSTLEVEKHGILIEKQSLAAEIKKISTLIEKIDALEPGIKCAHCYGEISEANYAEIKNTHLTEGKELGSKYKVVDQKEKSLSKDITEKASLLNQAESKLVTIRSNIKSLEVKGKNISAQIEKLSKIKVPDTSIQKAGILEKIKIIQESVEKLKKAFENGTPYDEMIQQSQEKLTLLASEFESLNHKLEIHKELKKYYDFWLVAFGDTGIRKYVLDEIIPALNDNINYWLQFLIDNKIEMVFDNVLEEKITKFPNDGKPLVYHILSNGQRRRINLALSQAFAHIMSLNTGRLPSVVFLDEVSSNIDPVGIECIYRMICELSKEKQVFITTHDTNLLELLNGCKEINLQMKNGVTSLV